jgi:hypothetical protein
MELSVSETLIFVFGPVVTLIWSAMLGILFRGIDEGSEAVKTQSPDSEGVRPGRGGGCSEKLISLRTVRDIQRSYRGPRAYRPPRVGERMKRPVLATLYGG